MLDILKPTQLILGPFHGKVACQTIAFGRGVCGVAAKTATTQLVHDVDQFPGHIACDGDSQSEIVVPIVQNDKVPYCPVYLERKALTHGRLLQSLISIAR